MRKLKSKTMIIVIGIAILLLAGTITAAGMGRGRGGGPGIQQGQRRGFAQNITQSPRQGRGMGQFQGPRITNPATQRPQQGQRLQQGLRRGVTQQRGTQLRARRGQGQAPRITAPLTQRPQQEQRLLQGLRQGLQQNGTQSWADGYRQGFADGLAFQKENPENKTDITPETGQQQRQRIQQNIRRDPAAGSRVIPNPDPVVPQGPRQGFGRGMRQGQGFTDNTLQTPARDGRGFGRGMRRGATMVPENTAEPEPEN